MSGKLPVSDCCFLLAVIPCLQRKSLQKEMQIQPLQYQKAMKVVGDNNFTNLIVFRGFKVIRAITPELAGCACSLDITRRKVAQT